MKWKTREELEKKSLQQLAREKLNQSNKPTTVKELADRLELIEKALGLTDAK